MVESLGFEPLLSQNVHQRNADIATRFNSRKMETSSRDEVGAVEIIAPDNNMKQSTEKNGQLPDGFEGKQLFETTSDNGRACVSQTKNMQKSSVKKPPEVDLSQSVKQKGTSVGSNFGDENISDCEIVCDTISEKEIFCTVTNASPPSTEETNKLTKAAHTDVQSNDNIAVGKLVKKRKSDSSDEYIDQTPPDKKQADKVTIKPVSSKVEEISGSKDLSESSEEDFNAKQTNPDVRKKRKPRKLGTATTKRDINLLQTNKRNKIIRIIESNDSSDSEEDSNSKRKSGVRAVRGLSALKKARTPSEPRRTKSSQRSPEVIVADDDCEVAIVEGTPLLSNPSRLGKLLKSQVQVKRSSNSKSIERVEQKIVAPECSTKNETQSEEIICDTPEERNKRISPKTTPRKQMENNVEQDNYTEDCVPPSQHKVNTAENTLHSDDEMFEQSPEDGSYQSVQASSFEPGSESLLIPPKIIGLSSKEELIENQTETKPDGYSAGNNVPGK